MASGNSWQQGVWGKECSVPAKMVVLQGFYGGRTWIRTTDLFLIREAL